MSQRCGGFHVQECSSGVGSGWTSFIDDFRWDVRACFVFDVDDAGLVVTQKDRSLMTSGQLDDYECSF